MIFINMSYPHTVIPPWGYKSVFEIRTPGITFVPVLIQNA